MLSSRRLLRLLGALAWLLPAGAAAQTLPGAFRPNIVWIIADDLSPIMGAYGDSTAQTPHLNRLAREGVTYEHAYVTVPVCAPSRTSMITGVYPTSMGALHMRTMSRTSALEAITDSALLAIPTYEAVPPPDVEPVTRPLQRAGYFTANRGKEDYQFKTPATLWDARGEGTHWRARPDPQQPFFYVFNDTETHESQMWRRAEEPLPIDPGRVALPPYYPDTPLVRRDVARNYANLQLTDAHVGRLLAELEADGVLEETVVFFFGDHGNGLPRMKRWLYDSGLRVPLIVRVGSRVREALGAGLDAPPPGGRVGRPVSLVDLAPTALALAGLQRPAYLAGLPFLADPQAPRRRYAFGAKGRMDPALDEARAVTDGRFKYLYNHHPERPFVQFLPYRDQMALMQELHRLHRAGALDSTQALWFRATKPQEELYDTEADPHEVRNLALDPRYGAELARLRGALAAWVEATGDLGPLDENDLKRRLWAPDGRQPRTAPPHATVAAAEGEIALSSPTPGALLMWAVGEEPWRPYLGPFRAAPGAEVRLRAHRLGYAPSDTAFVAPR